MLWRRFSGEPLRIPVKTAVEEAIIRETNAGYRLKVCIGTDSQVRHTETDFATVIVFPAGKTWRVHVHQQRPLYSAIHY